MVLLGGVILTFPGMMIPIWPWLLYSLTTQAIGAWCVGIGIIALHAVWENDWSRLFPLMVGYATYGVLQVINLMRYPERLEWSRFPALAYTIFMISILLTGVYGSWTAWSVNKV